MEVGTVFGIGIGTTSADWQNLAAVCLPRAQHWNTLHLLEQTAQARLCQMNFVSGVLSLSYDFGCGMIYVLAIILCNYCVDGKAVTLAK